MAKARFLFALYTAVMLGSPGQAVLVNGGFEDTAATFVDNGQNTMELSVGSTAIPGWSIIGDTVAWIDTPNPYGLAANEGDYFLDLTNYQAGAPFGGVTQTISTMAGHKYLLTFDLGSSSRWGLPDGLTATAGSASQSFLSTLTGINNWENHVLEFTASGDTTVISFRGNAGNNYIGLDNVTIRDLGVGGVPEPATWAMLLTGFGAMGVRMRRGRPKIKVYLA